MSLNDHDPRRRPGRSVGRLALAALAVALLVGHAHGGDDPYSSIEGTAAGNTLAIGGVGRRAGMTVNPGRTGQVLFGAYFDVRALVLAGGGTDSQLTLISIRNESTPDKKSSAYDPRGGVLLRMRFRESKYGLPSDNIDIALGCGQTWSGTLSLGSDGIARIRSADPVRSALLPNLVTTLVTLNGSTGKALTWSGGLDRPLDLQRGLIEVFAVEALPCKPTNPPISRTGNSWARIGAGGDATPPNSLSGSVAVVQVLRDTAYQYDMQAVTRHRITGSGSASPLLPAAAVPSLTDCVGPVNSSTPSTYTGSPSCIRQANFALSREQLHFRFESHGATQTRLVLTLPTRPFSCLLNVDGSLTPAYPGVPFGCGASGERIGTSVEDDLAVSTGIRTARLDRVTTILSIGPERDPLADVWVRSDGIEIGSVHVDLARAGSGALSHFEVPPDPNGIDFLGIGFAGFEGLPVVPLGLQQTYSEFAGTTQASTFKPNSSLGHLAE